jgi:hypothetical protein
VNDSTLGLGGEAGVEASVTLADSIVTYNQETGIDNQRFAAA